MPRETLSTTRAPLPAGPYVQAVRAQGLVFVSGQLPLDPVSGRLVTGDIAAQTRCVIEAIAAILADGGGSLADLVKTTVFLADLDDFPGMNAVYAALVPEPYPARSTVEVSRLPPGARLEIDAIALAR